MNEKMLRELLKGNPVKMGKKQISLFNGGFCVGIYVGTFGGIDEYGIDSIHENIEDAIEASVK